MNDKVIVITGGTGGLGQALIDKLISEDYFVAFSYLISENVANEIIKKYSHKEDQIMACQVDITDEQSVEKFRNNIIEKYGKIDILINNAGICEDSSVLEMNFDSWKRVIDINLTGTYICCKEFLKSMIYYDKCKIINIASVKGLFGSNNQVNYCSSKAGIFGLTKALAKECGKYNISINAVCPGYIETNMNFGNKRKKDTAENKSVLSIDKLCNTFTHFISNICSDNFSGVSGQIFILDSRIN